MNKLVIQTINNLGLNDKEAKTYLACLKLGSGTVQQIAKEAQIKRTSIYNFIDKLIDLGLIAKTEINNRYYYLAENPETLNELQKKNQFDLTRIMPDLFQIYNQEKTQTNFKYFRGKEGTKKIWKQTLNVSNKLIYWTTANEASIDIVGKRFTENYIIEAKNRGIKSLLLRNPKQKGKHRFFIKDTLTQFNREARELPKEINLKNSFIIYDNKVACLAPIEENYGFVIESRSFADSMKSIYKALWNISKKY